MPLPVFVGIDVACAFGKRLPICFVEEGHPLRPLLLPKRLAGLFPRGVGNREITAAAPFQAAARGAVDGIKQVADEMGWQIKRIAIDAPAAPPVAGSRSSENELGLRGLSSFRTPAASDWAGIREKCNRHLDLGGSTATLPHANKLWMLFGFELFAQLRNLPATEVIEVYPFAIVRELLSECKHKSTEKGYSDQLNAIAVRTGWNAQDLETTLKSTVPGNRHDRLDAFMAGWVASLPPEGRRAYGDPHRPNDSNLGAIVTALAQDRRQFLHLVRNYPAVARVRRFLGV